MKVAPLPRNEAERLEVLRRTGLLDSDPEAAFDDFTRLAASLCGTPIALISLVDEERQWFKSRVGLEARETPREVAFCAHAILDEHVLVVPDAFADDRFADNPLVTGEPRVRFYAGAPLVTPDGFALGTLCVIDHQPRALREDQLDALRILARQASAQIQLRRVTIELADKNLELERLGKLRNDVIAMLSHDIRNPLMVVQGCVELLLAGDGFDETERRTMLAEIGAAARQANLLALNFLDATRIETGPVELRRSRVEIGELLARVVRQQRVLFEAVGVEGVLEEPEGALPPIEGDEAQLERVFTNLVHNAIRFTPKGGKVRVTARSGSGAVEVEVEDSGEGIAPDLAGRLFERYTRGKGKVGSTGLGLFVVKTIVEAHGGRVSGRNRDDGPGARFRVSLPTGS